jgi:hypothetical protein
MAMTSIEAVFELRAGLTSQSIRIEPSRSAKTTGAQSPQRA